MQQKGSERFKQVFFSPKVVGTVDGTHLGLATKPSLYGEDYFTGKSRYAVVAMVVKRQEANTLLKHWMACLSAQ